MNLLQLLLSLSIAPFSYAYYKATKNESLALGPDMTVFRIGRDIYSYGGEYNGSFSKFGFDDNKNFYSKVYHTDDLKFNCIFCFSFVMNNNSVLTLTGYDDLNATNESYNNNMGIYYFNPNEGTLFKDANYKMLQGNPSQRFFHQAVLTPDNASIYIFGGFDYATPKNVTLNIVQFDISTSTFSNHDIFTFVGGTATMLPSGIAVLAFGGSNVNQTDGKALYNTSSVYLYDTNKNELYTQSVSGTPPPPRGSATGTLGPDNECIYYFGGDNFDLAVTPEGTSFAIYYDRLRIRSDLVVLNTTSWTWFSPNVSGQSSGGRYQHFSLLYEDNSLILGGGMMIWDMYNDIAVLKNLPTNGESADLNNLRWFTNSNLDNLNNDSRIYKSSMIAGIVIGVVIFVIIIFYIFWKKFKFFKRIIWKKRRGEPVWTEIVRSITRFVLFGVLIAYIIYSIIRAINSPTINQEQIVEMDNMPLIDIRICSTAHKSNSTEFSITCIFTDGQDCSKHFYPITNSSLLPSLQNPSCQVFIPPLDLNFQSSKNAYLSGNQNLMDIGLFKKNTMNPLSSFYFSYYARENSPYRTLFEMNGEDSKMTPQDAINWIHPERELIKLRNTFNVAVGNYINTYYSLTETQALTNSSWNYFGFASVYNTTIDIEQKVDPQNGLVNVSTVWDPALIIRVIPNEYSIRIIKEQRVSTIVSGLASAGGVFSVIMAIQAFLFGFRPDSPWGIIHRWSWGRRSRTLREQLRDQFNADDSPVPMVTRVRGEYYSIPESSHPTTLEMTPLTVNDDNQNDGLKLRKMEGRIQLMEDLFRTYYINDEIFQKLNEASKNDTENNEENDEKKEQVKSDSGFTSIYYMDEEAPIYQTDQRKKSKIVP